MPLRDFVPPSDKREELKTYRELGLRRDLKSARQRKRIAASGQKRVLGNGSSGQPYLIVETARYRQVRADIQRALLLQAREQGLDLDVDLLLGQLQPRIEALAYAQLAEEISHEPLRHIPLAALGRALTAEERGHFAASRAVTETPATGSVAASSSRVAINHVLGQIEQRQSHNPVRYQTLWAQVVGADAASQSFFEKVDPATGTAWFKCFNSALSYDLQRRPALVQKLAKALGLPVRQLRARF